MTKILSFKDLRVWQEAQELVEQIYLIAKIFPASERFGLVDQMCRASVSVSSNIAEGKGRESTKEYKRYLIIARGSVQEIISQIDVVRRLQFIDQIQLDNLSTRYSGLGSGINALILSLSEFEKTKIKEAFRF